MKVVITHKHVSQARERLKAGDGTVADMAKEIGCSAGELQALLQEGAVDIHKAENPNLYAGIQYPALVSKARYVKKLVDENGQWWTPKEVKDSHGKIEIVGETEFIEFQQRRVESEQEAAPLLKNGWSKTPREAELALLAKRAPKVHTPKDEVA